MGRILRIYVAVLSLVSLLALSAPAARATDVTLLPLGIAVTGNGMLQGIFQGDVLAFRGIPYVAPPVGRLRWRAPQPPPSWQGIRDASTFGNVCPQINFELQLVGDEDCLTLNVYIARNTSHGKQPVMVFFHGGGNFAGDAQSPPFDLPTLADHGVVVVTAQYRLGFLGFLAHPLLTAEDSSSSGAYAMLDQIAALRWVQRNIAAFEGDARRVMAFGQSAGSYDLQALLTAPLAQGLFSTVGMESGSIPRGQLPSFAVAEIGGVAFAEGAGCGNSSHTLACLRAIPADTIVTQPNLYLLGPGVGSRFLPNDPAIVLQEHGSPVPLLIGSTREEWAGISDNPNADLDEAGYEAAIHQRFDSIGPGIADRVLQLYPASDYDTPAYALIAVDTDYAMTCEVRNVARATAGMGRPPVWRYFYTHRFENDSFLNSYRAFHTAELYFVFDDFNGVFGIIYSPTPAEVTFTEELIGYWTRFAATGNPNGAGAVPWPAYEANNYRMLRLDDTFRAMGEYHETQCNFLSTLPQP